MSPKSVWVGWSFFYRSREVGGGGGDSHMKGVGMLVVSLEGVNFRQNAIIS